MAEELHLRRRIIIPLPILTPRLSSLWISVVTPVSYRIARPLAEGLRNRVVVTKDDTQRLMPHHALGAREAIHQAIQQVEANAVETRWSAAGPIPGDPEWAGGTVFTDQRSVSINAHPKSVFAAVCRIGGGNGWYAGDILWRIRGWMDTLVGGPGLRRGRRNSEQVEFGEALDFWRVVGLDREKSLSLLAEMKLPGQAMLNFQLEPEADSDQTKLTMTARFRPKGLMGILYWYAVLPLHNVVFGGMLKGIRRTAEAMHRSENPTQVSAPSVKPMSDDYGRARLWLGISAVGTMVLLCILGLVLGLPVRIQQYMDPALGGQLLALLGFVLVYAAVQLPFDLLGGYFLPKRYGRPHHPLGRYLVELGRAVLTHGMLQFLIAALLLLAGMAAGVIGTVAVGMIIMIFLLLGRVALASLMAPLELTPSGPSSTLSRRDLPVVIAQSGDESFTGGMVGLFRPRYNLLPEKWREVLGPDGFALVMSRRCLAAESGSWWRGRLVALLFTLAGLTLASWLVGSTRLGTAGGIVELSLWFSLWSFIGLLTLPSLSRRGVIEIDDRVRAEGVPATLFRKTVRQLDDFQGGEQERSGWVETIFHPIPSMRNRLDGPRSLGIHGYWDVARTSIYLSLSSLGLLGRAVHCNCGKPALWVFLPTD